MTTNTTPPTPHPHEALAERGSEVHPSWVSVRFNKSSWSPPGAQLVGSDIRHQHVVTLRISSMSRTRDLHHTWWHEERELMEVYMSEAQFAAAITSFGDGSARPATLAFHQGPVEQCADTRPGEIAQSIAEVRAATAEASANVQAKLAEVEKLLEEGAGKKALRDAVSDARAAANNLPSNMAFAAKSMAETVEKVVTKATHDIEAIVELRARAVGLELDAYPITRQLLSGDEPSSSTD